MKKFYKHLIPFFGASFFNNQLSSLAKNVVEPKEIFISTNLEKAVHVQDHVNLDFEKEKNILNQQKVFLIVKNVNSKQKSDKNILILLDTNDHLNACKHNYQVRQDKHITALEHSLEKNKGKYKDTNIYRYSQDFRKGPAVIYDPFYMLANGMRRKLHSQSVLESGRKSLFTSLLRGGKSYFVSPEGGYKSICPVFFDENSAQNFIIENTERDIKNLVERKNTEENQSPKDNPFKLPFLSNKKRGRGPKLIKNLQNFKIICLGLGDFVEYYSTMPNKKALEKVEFFFVPDLESLLPKPRIRISRLQHQTTKVIGNNKTKQKGFKSYQKQLYEVKKQVHQKNK